MEKPKSLSVKVTFEDGREQTLTYDVADWEDIESGAPLAYPILHAWAEEFYGVAS